MDIETVNTLKTIPGGLDVIALLKGSPNFHDSEVVSVVFEREGQSKLVLAVDAWSKFALVSFHFSGWIDGNINGFSHQNVIGELTIRKAGDRKIEPWELGVGLDAGLYEITLLPCFGAHGTIRAHIEKIVVELKGSDIMVSHRPSLHPEA